MHTWKWTSSNVTKAKRALTWKNVHQGSAGLSRGRVPHVWQFKCFNSGSFQKSQRNKSYLHLRQRTTKTKQQIFRECAHIVYWLLSKSRETDLTDCWRQRVCVCVCVCLCVCAVCTPTGIEHLNPFKNYVLSCLFLRSFLLVFFFFSSSSSVICAAGYLITRTQNIYSKEIRSNHGFQIAADHVDSASKKLWAQTNCQLLLNDDSSL